MSKSSPVDPAIPLINAISDSQIKQSLMSIFSSIKEELARRANGKKQLKKHNQKLKEELESITARYEQLLQDHMTHQQRVKKLIEFSQNEYPTLFLDFTKWLDSQQSTDND